MHDGVHMHLGNIAKLSKAKTRLITAENVYGEPGKGGMADYVDEAQPEVTKLGQRWVKEEAARELGQRWKARPSIVLPSGEPTKIMDVDGPGVIQHIWLAMPPKRMRDVILRMYWDGEDMPSVEVPIADFFNSAWGNANIVALPINVNPKGGMNCYFPMPFRRHATVTVETRHPEDCPHFYYAITYAIPESLDDDEAYFHAQFRRTNPLPYKSDYTLLDGVRGKGHYVGTYMAWQQNSTGWWGEGEIKFFLDGDREFPTLCGTGTEDYFGGAWCFGENYSAPYLGYPVGASDGKPGNRHGLYRYHIPDPIRFESELRVTMQAIGWRERRRYLPLQDDIASVAYWYQAEPHAAFPPLGSPDDPGNT